MPDLLRPPLRPAFNRPHDLQAPGLLFTYGMANIPDDPTQRGKEIAQFVQRVAAQTAPPIYKRAYQRWRTLTSDPAYFQRWIGRVEGRLFIGLGEPHVLETNLTFSQPYGVPMLPGSTLKGLARAQAKYQEDLDQTVISVLFGQQDGPPEENDAGYLLFHDAWWIPDSAHTPLAREVVTVHHPDYYGQEGGQAATDFDSPNPNAQLAARGAFLFVVEGVGGWATLGLRLLRTALENVGVGGKTAAGYGYFVDDPVLNQTLSASLKIAALKTDAAVAVAGTDMWRQEVASWDLSELADRFGKNYNKTRQRYGENFADVVALVRERYQETLNSWAQSPRDNERKAFKKLQESN